MNTQPPRARPGLFGSGNNCWNAGIAAQIEEGRSAFESQRVAECQKMLDPLGGSVAAMCEQPMSPSRLPKASEYPPENNCDKESVCVGGA